MGEPRGTPQVVRPTVVPMAPPRRRERLASAQFLQQSPPRPDYHSKAASQAPSEAEPIHFVEGSYGISSEVSSIESAPSEDDLMAFGQQGRYVTPAPHITFMSEANRLGWSGSQYPPRQPASQTNAPRCVPIFHDCYEHGHISPQCILPVRQMRQVLENYETLTGEEKSYLPDTSYIRVRTALKPEEPTMSTSPGQRVGPPQKEPMRGSRYGDAHYARAVRNPKAQSLFNEEYKTNSQGDHHLPDNRADEGQTQEN